ncbi:hypothetical protein [Nocardia harenae]|uniref:hypothetical protein n=1 Tax=Nocardia harenae TaxID=358707 RepID=UPI000831C6BE|nr:hypothetical protein [Nocardia harenae]
MTRLGPRDMTALTILAEMYGAPMDVLARMLGVTVDRAARVARNWTEAQMLAKQRVTPVPGRPWVFPTRAAVEALTGRATQAWLPTPKMAAHTRAVLELRLALVGLDLDRWISERSLRAEVGPTKAGVARPHIHDGRFLTDAGQWWAVEVELTPKNLGAARKAMAAAVRAAQRAECESLVYYCRSDAVKAVTTDAAASLDLSSGPKVRLRDLDAELSSSPPRPGLRVIEGGASDHEIPQVTDPNEGKAG